MQPDSSSTHETEDNAEIDLPIAAWGRSRRFISIFTRIFHMCSYGTMAAHNGSGEIYATDKLKVFRIKTTILKKTNSTIHEQV